MRNNSGFGLALSAANPGLLAAGSGPIDIPKEHLAIIGLIGFVLLMAIAVSAIASLPDYQPVTPIMVKAQL